MLGPSQSFSAKLQFRALGTSQGKKKKKKKNKKKNIFWCRRDNSSFSQNDYDDAERLQSNGKKVTCNGETKKAQKNNSIFIQTLLLQVGVAFSVATTYVLLLLIRTTSEINLAKMARSDDLVVSIGTTVGSLQRRREFDSRCHQPFSGFLPFQICSVSAYSEKKFKKQQRMTKELF